MDMRLGRLLRLTLLLVLAASVSACEAIGTIFEAGVWVGVFLVVVVIAVIGFIAAKVRQRP